jgi:uncharacterized protein (DUF58 family)
MIPDLQRNRVERFGKLGLLARNVVEGFITGLHKSPFHGFSVEFSEHRLYNPGESVKHVDWKLYARTDKLFVKRYEEETNLRCHLIIDNSSSMYFPHRESVSPEEHNKVGFAAYSAAALMYLMRKQRDAVGLSLFSDHIELHTQARSSALHHEYLFHQLEILLQGAGEQERKSTTATAALHSIAEKIHKRSLVVIFSDFFDQANHDELFRALQHLRYNKHEVIVFHVAEKHKELDFEFSSRPHRFIDMESGQSMRVNPSLVREDYIKAVEEHRRQIRLKCRQYKIDYVDAIVNQGFEQVLLPYLIKRSRLF